MEGNTIRGSPDHDAGRLHNWRALSGLKLPPRSARNGRIEVWTPTRGMDTNKMLAEIRAEREAIEEAIMALERLDQGEEGAAGALPRG